MALSLPYDLVFAPLDVLTAEEMNEIVQNYTTIAQAFPIGTENILGGSVTDAKLADRAVTSAKFNYSSVLSNLSLSNTFTSTVGTSYSQVTSFNISSMPVGARFFAIAKVKFTGSDTVTSVATRLAYNSDYGTEGASTTAWGRNLDTYGVFTKTTTNTLTIQASKDNSSSVVATGAQLMAFRVG